MISLPEAFMEIDREQLTEAVRKLQAGDGEAFETLYRLTSRPAYFTALKIVRNETDAQDVLQDSYMIVLDKISELQAPEAFMSWFNMIVANKAKELLRKNKKYLFADSEDAEQVGPDHFFEGREEAAPLMPVDSLEQEELKAQMRALIDGLDDDKRTVILLYYYSELTTRQIAESLDVNENTIKSRLFYAKRELAEGVKAYEKKHGQLRSVAPLALLLLALREASAATSTAFVKSGASAATLSAITASSQAAAGTAAAGTAAAGSTAAASVSAGSTAAAAAGSAAAKLIGASVVQKAVAGVVAAAVIGGGAIGIKQAVQRSMPPASAETTLSETANAAWMETPETTLTAEFLAELTTRPAAASAATEPVTTAAASTQNAAHTAARSTSAVPTAADRTTQQTSAVRTTAVRTKAVRTTTAKTTKTATTAQTTAAAPKTTAPTTTETPPTTKPTTKPTTTKPATTTQPAATTTQKQTATVQITITQGGSPAGSTSVTVDDGDTFTFADAKSAVAAEGYDTTYAEYSGGTLPITAQAGRTYSITIDVE